MGTEMALLAMVATSAAVSGAQAISAADNKPQLPDPSGIPSALAGEADAQKQGAAARRKQLLAVGESGGRGSTILTGGNLGLGGNGGQGKTLLGG